jgi:hypothetical protein
MWKEKPNMVTASNPKELDYCNLQFRNTSTHSLKRRTNKSHRHTWGLHKNASLGKFSVLLFGSTGSCDFCNILDLVTFLAPECWATSVWCFATRTVGAACEGPTSSVEYTQHRTGNTQNAWCTYHIASMCSNYRLWKDGEIFCDFWLSPSPKWSPASY